MAPARDARLRPGRLRLHDLHRQLRAARRGDRQRDRGQRPGRRRGPVGQPQLRGPDPSARPGELPRLAAARRRLRPGRPGRHRPDQRAARRSAVDGRPVFLADIWPEPEEIRTVIAESIDPRALPADLRDASSTATTAGARCRSRRATATPGIAARPTSPSRRSSTASALDAGAASADLDGMRVPGRPRRFGHHRPHLAGRLDRAVVARRPVAPGARRRAARVQLVRRPARPARGDDPRARSRNIRLRNGLVEGKEGPYTVHLPDGERGVHLRRRDALRRRGRPAGDHGRAEYGSGSSRDWAAKGPALLGVRVVIAESFERIHRSNLVGMGILPLQFQPGESAASLGLTGRETLSISGLADGPTPRQRRDGRRARSGRRRRERRFAAIARLDGPIDVEYYRRRDPAGGPAPPRARGVGRRSLIRAVTDTKKPSGEEPRASARRSRLCCLF